MGRKPRPAGCRAARPHRRHEKSLLTQNSCICNEGELLLLQKLLDASLLPGLKSDSSFFFFFLFCALALAKHVKGRDVIWLTGGFCVFVHIPVCLFMTSLEVLPASPTMLTVRQRYTQAALVPIVKVSGPPQFSFFLTSCLPFHDVSTETLDPVDHTRGQTCSL